MKFRRLPDSFFLRFPVLLPLILAVVAGIIGLVADRLADRRSQESPPPPPVRGGATPAAPKKPKPATPRPSTSPPKVDAAPSSPAAAVVVTSAVCVLHADSGPKAAFAKSRATAVARRLALTGVEAPLLPMAQLANALTGECAVAHLVLPTEPSKAQMRALRAFTVRGGRLVVHCSDSPALCAFFGVTPPGDPQGVPPAEGDWTGYAFTGPPPLHAPAAVAQRAPSILEVRPARADVRILASWSSESGEEGPPAVLRGPAGFWLSRPLYDDLSAADSSRFLLSLTATLHPPVWKGAATALGKRVAALRAAVPPRRKAPKANRERLDALLSRLDALEKTRADKTRHGLYGASLAELWEQERLLALADAVSKPLGPVRGDARLGVWSKSPWPPGTNTWDSAAAALAEVGVSDLYLFAGTLSGAIPDVKGVPADPGRNLRGDPFPAAVEACHARGIRVHAWVFSLQADLRDGARYADTNLTRRLLHSPGRTRRLEWLDPAVKTNGNDLASFVCALATETGVDGVNLDYFRYPLEATDEKRKPETLTALLRRVGGDLRKVAPDCELSVSVYAYTSTVAQEWDAWLDEGLADMALVMNYAPDVETLKRYMALHSAHRKRQICGIGASTYQSLLTSGELLAQLRAAYGEDYAGAAIYPFDERFLGDYAEPLGAAK